MTVSFVRDLPLADRTRYASSEGGQSTLTLSNSYHRRSSYHTQSVYVSHESTSVKLKLAGDRKEFIVAHYFASKRSENIVAFCLS